MIRTYLLLALTAILMLPPVYAAAQTSTTNQVGPNTFHKRIEIPNAVGKQTQFNNEDTFNGRQFDRQKQINQRKQRIQNRKNRNRNVETEEERTQSQKVETDRRGMRKNNSTRHQNQRNQKPPTANTTGVNN
jgi:hypothetical protein